jgi:hypothetical protein
MTLSYDAADAYDLEASDGVPSIRKIAFCARPVVARLAERSSYFIFK